MTRRERIAHALTHTLAPSLLQVVDESHQHAGHAGARPEGETHYAVHVVSDAFTGKGRVDRHRLVNTLLAGEFESGLHALALTLKAPGE